MGRYLALMTLLLLLPATVAGAERPAPRILFDEGHGQLFRIAGDGDLDLSLLSEKMRAGGAVVTAVEHFTAATLAEADALVISGPFRPLAADEIAAVLAFVERGGRLAVMLHIAPPASPLLTALGIAYSNGVVRETAAILEEQPLNFTVRDLAPHPLFAGVEQFAVFGAWALNASDPALLVARSGPEAWVDRDRDGQKSAPDAVAAFALVAAGTRGKGQFVVFGDDAIFQNRYLRAYNNVLGDALARWLKGEI
jgi:hypothetical protein